MPRLAARRDASAATVRQISRLSITQGPAISVSGPPASPTESLPTEIINLYPFHTSLSRRRRSQILLATHVPHLRRQWRRRIGQRRSRAAPSGARIDRDRAITLWN